MKNTQPLRRQLEQTLDRTVCDDTWHKLRKRLIANGIDYPSFPLAFEMIKQIHAGKTGNNYRIIPPNEILLSEWESFKKYNKTNSKHKMTCDLYLRRLINACNERNELIPKDRYKGNKRIGYNTIWYRWFQSCGIPFEQDKEYTISQLIAVNYHLKLWQIKHRKRLADSIFDAEIV